MKGLYLLWKRFVSPYKRYVAGNFIFNLLGALFGAVQLLTLKPVLGLLFEPKKIIEKPVEWLFSLKNIGDNLMHELSNIVQKSGSEKALIYLGVFMLIMVFLKVGFSYLALYVMVPLRNGVVRDIRN